MSENSAYFAKYLKYKNKYLQLQKDIYGGGPDNINASEAEILFKAFDKDGNGNLSGDELIANKDSGNLSLEKMVDNYATRLVGVDKALITRFVRAVSGGSKNFTPVSTDAFNKQQKLLSLKGNKANFVTVLTGLKLL